MKLENLSTKKICDKRLDLKKLDIKTNPTPMSEREMDQNSTRNNTPQNRPARSRQGFAKNILAQTGLLKSNNSSNNTSKNSSLSNKSSPKVTESTPNWISDNLSNERYEAKVGDRKTSFETRKPSGNQLPVSPEKKDGILQSLESVFASITPKPDLPRIPISSFDSNLKGSHIIVEYISFQN